MGRRITDIRPSTAFSTVDLDGPGKPVGFVMILQQTVTYRADGILYGRRQPGRVKPGNCCLVVAAPYRGTND